MPAKNGPEQRTANQLHFQTHEGRRVLASFVVSQIFYLERDLNLPAVDPNVLFPTLVIIIIQIIKSRENQASDAGSAHSPLAHGCQAGLDVTVADPRLQPHGRVGLPLFLQI